MISQNLKKNKALLKLEIKKKEKFDEKSKIIDFALVRK